MTDDVTAATARLRNPQSRYQAGFSPAARRRDILAVCDTCEAQALRIERLIGDKRRIHGLLQGAWSLMDPASDPILHEEIVRELDAGCETGRCTDACEANREAQAQEIARLTEERDYAQQMLDCGKGEYAADAHSPVCRGSAVTGVPCFSCRLVAATEALRGERQRTLKEVEER